jgi:hypothetical protein
VPTGLAEAIGRAGDQQAIFAHAAAFGVQVRHLRPSVPTLEDVFAKAVGEPTESGGGLASGAGAMVGEK